MVLISQTSTGTGLNYSSTKILATVGAPFQTGESMTFSRECPQCGKPKMSEKALCVDCAKLPVYGKKHTVRVNGRKYKVFIFDKSLMLFGPGEARPEDADFYESNNALCRCASKMLSNGLGWPMVKKQLEGSTVTDRNTLVKEILKRVSQADRS